MGFSTDRENGIKRAHMLESEVATPALRLQTGSQSHILAREWSLWSYKSIPKLTIYETRMKT